MSVIDRIVAEAKASERMIRGELAGALRELLAVYEETGDGMSDAALRARLALSIHDADLLLSGYRAEHGILPPVRQ